jgi:hypothetical protein
MMLPIKFIEEVFIYLLIYIAVRSMGMTPEPRLAAQGSGGDSLENSDSI